MRATAPESPLKRARLAAELTQLQLASRAGTTIGVISMAERSGYLTRPTAEKLAAALGIDPAVLLRVRP